MKQLLEAGRTIVAASAMAIGVAAGAAEAGDLAQSDIIGFSADGRYVAFQEYGQWDESDVVYANILVIDVAANASVEGAPIRVQLDPEAMPTLHDRADPVGEARAQAMEDAEPVLDRYGIVDGNTGTTLIYHPLSDVTADPHLVEFSIGRGFAPPGRTLQTMQVQSLHLTQEEVPSARCDQQQLGPVSTMSLELQAEGLDGPVTLHREDGLPDARDCTTGYRIQSVIAYFPENVALTDCCRAQVALLVVLSMSQFGHGGEDWRHMGVTALLDGAW